MRSNAAPQSMQHTCDSTSSVTEFLKVSMERTLDDALKAKNDTYSQFDSEQGSLGGLYGIVRPDHPQA